MTDRERLKVKEPRPDELSSRRSLARKGDSSADSEILHVRRVVASNPNTPRQVLMRLAGDASASIRQSIAENPKSPPEVLRKLCEDIEAEVRLAIAENPNTPADVLATLATDVDVDVRYGVAENPRMPETILFALSSDENPYIKCRALKTLKMLSPDVQSRLKVLLQESYEGMMRSRQPS